MDPVTLTIVAPEIVKGVVALEVTRATIPVVATATTTAAPVVATAYGTGCVVMTAYLAKEAITEKYKHDQKLKAQGYGKKIDKVAFEVREEDGFEVIDYEPREETEEFVII